MTEELARRAMACKHWRWLPGMRAVHRWTGGIRVLATDTGEWSEKYLVVPDQEGNVIVSPHEWGIMGSWPDGDRSAYPILPDLTDAATIGCLLALVREARQEPWYYPTAQVYGGQVLWLVERPVSERQTLCESEASALVAALEAAP